jgi:hypothetical protein
MLHPATPTHLCEPSSFGYWAPPCGRKMEKEGRTIKQQQGCNRISKLSFQLDYVLILLHPSCCLFMNSEDSTTEICNSDGLLLFIVRYD